MTTINTYNATYEIENARSLKVGDVELLVGGFVIVDGDKKISKHIFWRGVNSTPDTEWQRGHDLAMAVSWPEMIVSGDCTEVLIMGGFDGVQFTNCVQRYTATGVVLLSPMPSVVRNFSSMYIMPTNAIIVAGGIVCGHQEEDEELENKFIWQFHNNKWKTVGILL